jgi:Flp pilus assembly protein TadG
MGRQSLDNERGATLALVAVTMFLFLGLAALAIDLGMVKASDAQAQRAADAAALAGASAFIDYGNSDQAVVDSAATARALDYATRHSIRTTPIAPGEVTVQVLDAEYKVRVTITRPTVSTWFANTFGISSVSVSRQAAAEAAKAGVSTNCLKPFLLPDRWYEADKVYQDVNGNNIMDATAHDGEAWFYQPTQTSASGGTDRYEAYDPENPLSTQTGYGSGASGIAGDRGLDLLLKPQTGNAQRMGNFYQILDPAAYGMDSTAVKDAIASGCITAAVGDTAVLKNGSTTSARQGVQALIAKDPDVVWDDAAGHPTATSAYPDWTQNPRVIVVAFYDPAAIAVTCDVTRQNDCTNASVPGTIHFQNFARIFLQNDPGNTGNIMARFVGYVSGGGGGETSGPTIRVLRLVE